MNTKYNIGDHVYTIYNNEIVNAKIFTIHVDANRTISYSLIPLDDIFNIFSEEFYQDENSVGLTIDELFCNLRKKWESSHS